MLSRLALIAALCVCLVASHDRAKAAEEDGAVLVTVTGKLGKTNRGAADPFLDAFFAYHEVSFEAAYAFDRSELAALGMEELTLSYPSWPKAPVTLRGPSLAAVLDRVQAQGKSVKIQALDGYAVQFEIETLRKGRFILAIEGDGRPLAIGGRGPAWLAFPPGSYPDQPKDSDKKLVWPVFHIAVE